MGCRGFVAALAASTALASLASAAQETRGKTAADWLHSMDGAFRSLDYDGVFSYYTAERAQLTPPTPTALAAGDRTLSFGVGIRTAARLATYRVVHKVIDGVERERIEHLDGPPREVLRVGNRIVCALPPGDELPALAGSLPAAPYAGVFGRRFEAMSDSYRVGFDGEGRIAGRSAIKLRVAPLDQDRFGYRLWLDEATGLLLRSELHSVAAEAAKLEIFQFTSLRVGDGVATEDLAPAMPNPVLHELTHAEAGPPAAAPGNTTAPSHWEAGWVPRGFRMASGNGPPSAGTAVSTLVYSDGLAAFSVFIEAMPADGAGNVVSRRGATVLLSQAKSGAERDHLVTVVGEVPVATARRIAAGVYQRR